MTDSASRVRYPWTANEIVGACLLNGVGAATLLISWWSSANTSRLGTQVAWIDVAVIGLLIAGGGNIIILLDGRKRVGLRIRGLIAPSVSPSPRSRIEQNGSGIEPTVRAPGMTWYHRPTCSLVSGKGVDAYDPASGGAEPCPICEP
jgi:hypothetical protein